MNKYLTAIIAALAAIAAFLLRGWFAGRTEQKLTKERDSAKVSAEQHKINSQGKSQEAAKLKQQQQKEDKINAADNNSISAGLDDMFNK